MPTVWIPALLRPLTGGRESVAAQGRSVRELIADLDAQFPGLQARLVENDAIRAGVAVVIDGQIARGGLGEAVSERSEVHFIPAIAGGLADS